AGQTCQDGACKAVAQEREELECHDTDDNNNGFKGVAHGILIGTTDEEVTKSDACTSILAGPIIPASQSSRYLQEWRCNTANRVYAHYVECPNGQSCKNGACSTQSSIVPPQGDEETVCIDSDNGKNLRVQGTTSGINKPAPGRDFSGTYTDSCRTLSTGPRVLEYSCNEENQVIFTYHECPAGTECNNGACKAVAAAQEEFLCGDETPAERNPAMHVGDYLKGGALNGYAVRLISISPFSSTDLTQVRDAQFQVQDKNGNALAYLKIEEGKTEKVSSLALLVKVTKLYKDADGIASADVSAEMCATAPVNPSIPMPSDEETVPPLVQKFALSQGWNLVAPQATRSLVISSNCHEWTMWTYDAFKQRYENAGRLTDNNYLPEKAFWVKAPTACVFETASRTGTLTLSYGMTLATGWNLIPGTSELWNVVQGNCLLVTGPYNYANGDWTRQVMLSRGKGYFVNVQSECTLGKNANQ
ncbi:TPA: hypothetical protein HA318_01290, partial [Candidatus Micrarchaeota archaeon]|nr:hypothetical protein [Candidatus Micrarchaeota archaeon]